MFSEKKNRLMVISNKSKIFVFCVDWLSESLVWVLYSKMMVPTRKVLMKNGIPRDPKWMHHLQTKGTKLITFD